VGSDKAVKVFDVVNFGGYWQLLMVEQRLVF
jgi:hypothetical protein